MLFVVLDVYALLSDDPIFLFAVDVVLQSDVIANLQDVLHVFSSFFLVKLLLLTMIVLLVVARS